MDNPPLGEPVVERTNLFTRQFNWRMLLVRVLVSALALLLTVLILPDIYLVEWSLLNVLFLGAVLGFLNAFVRPVLQFLTLSLIFVTYGLVIVLINTIILLLLSILFPNRIGVDGVLWALVGGAVIGILASALEGLFGLTLPIMPDGIRSQSSPVSPAVSLAVTQTNAGSGAAQIAGQTETAELASEVQPALLTAGPPVDLDPVLLPDAEGEAVTQQPQTALPAEEER